MQKWPNYITTIRHAESEYNALNKEKIPHYLEFIHQFDTEYNQLTLEKIVNNIFPSPKLIALAKSIVPHIQNPISDFDTDLAPGAFSTAVQTGKRLKDLIDLPDVIYLSPYKRTRETLRGLLEGWKELNTVVQIEDDRIREQEHGKRTIYRDPKLYCVFNPEHAYLYKCSTPYEYKHEGGESLLNVRDRLRVFVSMLLRKHGGVSCTKTTKVIWNQRNLLKRFLCKQKNLDEFTIPITPENVLVITHHKVIQALKANLEGWSREQFLENDKNNVPPNCSVTIYKGAKDTNTIFLEKENLILYNETSSYRKQETS